MYNIKKNNSILENFSTHCGFRLVWNESKIAISSAEHDFACVNSIELNFSLFASLNQINSMVWEPYSQWVKINSEGAFLTFTRYFIKFDTIFGLKMGSDKITYWLRDTLSFWVLLCQKNVRGCELNFWLEYKITNLLGFLT